MENAQLGCYRKTLGGMIVFDAAQLFVAYCVAARRCSACRSVVYRIALAFLSKEFSCASWRSAAHCIALSRIAAFRIAAHLTALRHTVSQSISHS